MIIYIQENREFQVARRSILIANVLLALMVCVAFLGMAVWLQKTGGRAGQSGQLGMFLFAPPWRGAYLFMSFLVFVFQILGYYKLAKVSRNLLIFRCVAFPCIADALLSLLALVLLPKASALQMLNLKLVTSFLYVYYAYRLFSELSRVTQDRSFKQGALLIGMCLSLLFMVFGITKWGSLTSVALGLLLIVGAVMGWGMIFLGFLRLKQISTP